jgi:hypothetical protein
MINITSDEKERLLEQLLKTFPTNARMVDAKEEAEREALDALSKPTKGFVEKCAVARQFSKQMSGDETVIDIVLENCGENISQKAKQRFGQFYEKRGYSRAENCMFKDTEGRVMTTSYSPDVQRMYITVRAI